MRVVQWAGPDPEVTKACHNLIQAANAVDDPHGPPVSARKVRYWLEQTIEPAETWFAVGDAPVGDAPVGDVRGGIQGWCHVVLPAQENTDRAYVSVVVHPELRRQGIGSELLSQAARRAAENGRAGLGGWAFLGTGSEEFARRGGSSATSLVGVRRILRLGALPDGRIARLRATAAKAAGAYTLTSWSGPAPDEKLDQVTSVFNALNDAPHAEGHERTTYDAQRIRDEIDAPRAALGLRVYSFAALHEVTGEMAALTQVEVEQEFPGWANQHMTAVTRSHRGHRLGLLVKTAMLEWLATAEPQLENIVTGNAASNDHMIAINEQLGYEVLEPQVRLYEMPVSPESPVSVDLG